MIIHTSSSRDREDLFPSNRQIAGRLPILCIFLGLYVKRTPELTITVMLLIVRIDLLPRLR